MIGYLIGILIAINVNQLINFHIINKLERKVEELYDYVYIMQEEYGSN